MKRCKVCGKRYLLTWMPLVLLNICSWRCRSKLLAHQQGDTQ